MQIIAYQMQKVGGTSWLMKLHVKMNHDLSPDYSTKKRIYYICLGIISKRTGNHYHVSLIYTC